MGSVSRFSGFEDVGFEARGGVIGCFRTPDEILNYVGRFQFPSG